MTSKFVINVRTLCDGRWSGANSLTNTFEQLGCPSLLSMIYAIGFISFEHQNQSDNLRKVVVHPYLLRLRLAMSAVRVKLADQQLRYPDCWVPVLPQKSTWREPSRTSRQNHRISTRLAMILSLTLYLGNPCVHGRSSRPPSVTYYHNMLATTTDKTLPKKPTTLTAIFRHKMEACFALVEPVTSCACFALYEPVASSDNECLFVLQWQYIQTWS